MKSSGSLSRRLALQISGGFVAIWLLAILATALVLRSEQEELFNLQLRETARVLLPVLEDGFGKSGPGIGPSFLTDDQKRGDDLSETLVYRLIGEDGAILITSHRLDEMATLPADISPGYAVTDTHVFYTTDFDDNGFAVQFGDPIAERNDAYLGSLLAFMLPMLAIVPLAYMFVGWIARSALRPLHDLRSEIEARGEARLDPIDAGNQPAELRAITATLNGLIARLGQSLEGERAFATNAAHELRTPIAVALAQVQRLKANSQLSNRDQIQQIDQLEQALKRMGRLVGRLLQLARADAGIGKSDQVHDVAMLLDAVVDESLRDPAQAGRLHVTRPKGPVLSQMDPDAFAIIVGNLIDNAFQHSPPGTGIYLELSEDGTFRISNETAIIPPSTLLTLTRRFQRESQNTLGFGLGLFISDRIASQSSEDGLTLRSPSQGRNSGLDVEFRVPLWQAPAKAP